MWYKVCERCGAALDPGEQCECVSNIQVETKKENASCSEAFPFKQLNLMTVSKKYAVPYET